MSNKLDGFIPLCLTGFAFLDRSEEENNTIFDDLFFQAYRKLFRLYPGIEYTRENAQFIEDEVGAFVSNRVHEIGGEYDETAFREAVRFSEARRHFLEMKERAAGKTQVDPRRTDRL